MVYALYETCKMPLKINAAILILSCLVSCVVTKAPYPGGCFECAEEVWEEVPCGDVPSSSTPKTYYTTTKPSSTTTSSTTTTPTTTTPTTTTTTPTTTTTTTTPTTTTTTPSPTTASTTESPVFKKCYCECKVGCKEFCRKVIVNSDIRRKVVEVSKLSIPKQQGRLEFTHFLQRQLKPNTYSNNYDTTEAPPPKYAYPPRVEAPLSAHAEATVNGIKSYSSHTSKTQVNYNSAPPSGTYEHPVSYHNIYTEVSKTPARPVAYSRITSSQYEKAPPVKNTYSKAPPNVIPYQDPLDDYLKDFLNANAQRYGPYETYSVAYR